ncbi:hypothetical protein Tco_1516806 [Tanacetum coccineum]
MFDPRTIKSGDLGAKIQGLIFQLDRSWTQRVPYLPKTALKQKAIQEMAEYSQKWHNRTSSRTKSTETSNGLAVIQTQLNNLGREIKKVNEKVYAAQVGCELCKGPHYTKDCPQKEEGKFWKKPTIHSSMNPINLEDSIEQQGRDSTNKIMEILPKRHEENLNIIKEIRASTDTALRNQGALIKTLKIQIGQMSKVLKERGFGSLPSSTEINPRDQVKSISTAKADFSKIRHIRHEPYAVSGTQYRSLFSETVPFPRQLQNFSCDYYREAQDVKILDTYDHSFPQKEKDPGSFTLPCFMHNIYFDKALVDLGASTGIQERVMVGTLIDIPVFVEVFLYFMYTSMTMRMDKRRCTRHEILQEVRIMPKDYEEIRSRE